MDPKMLDQRELHRAYHRDKLVEDLQRFEENVYPPFQDRGFTFKEAYIMCQLKDINTGVDNIETMIREYLDGE